MWWSVQSEASQIAASGVPLRTRIEVQDKVHPPIAPVQGTYATSLYIMLNVRTLQQCSSV
eukprot:8943487-Pyramimonas_sp.AAC.1